MISGSKGIGNHVSSIVQRAENRWVLLLNRVAITIIQQLEPD
ncbi:MAG: hypothetical protein ACK2US_01735 [Anaerolineae bacterium]|jgi:hypothetical protein